MTRRSNPEYNLQVAVVAHLERRAARNVYWCHVPNEGRRTPKQGAQMKRLGMSKGAPDLIVLCDGRACALELKSKTGRLTMAQVATRDKWRAAGGTYAVAYNIDEALDYLISWGAIL